MGYCELPPRHTGLSPLRPSLKIAEISEPPKKKTLQNTICAALTIDLKRLSNGVKQCSRCRNSGCLLLNEIKKEASAALSATQDPANQTSQPLVVSVESTTIVRSLETDDF